MNFWKKLFAAVDMTTGRPWEKIVLFTIPMLIGNFAQQLYNTVDSIVVGNFVGDNALAAVGSAGPLINMQIVLYIGIGMGASIMVSQYFGARDGKSLSHTIGNSINLTIIASLIIMIFGTALINPLLKMLNTPDSILEWCAGYLRIMFIGGAGLAFYNILSGILRGLGDSMSALLYLIIASVMNIGLDLLFVIKFGMGVNGVALATVFSQGFSAVLCLRKLYRMKDIFVMKLEHLRPNRKYAGQIIRLGVPSGLTQAIISMSMIVVQSLTNQFGEQFIAASVILMRVDGFAMLPNFSFGTAMTTYAGQNIGAKRIDRVKQGAKQGTLLAAGTSGLITISILIFGKSLMGIFTNTPELVDISIQLMKILAVGYIAMGVIQSFSGIMRGAGDTMTPMWISLVQTVLIRVPLAYGLCYLTRSDMYPIGRQECIYYSLLIAWLLGGLITCIFYAKGNWKKKALIK